MLHVVNRTLTDGVGIPPVLLQPLNKLPSTDRMMLAGSTLPRSIGAHLGVVLLGWAASQLISPDGRKHTLRLLLPGDVFGLEMLTGQPAIGLTQAITDCRYRLFTEATIEAAFDNSDTFRLSALALLGQQQATADKWLAACLGATAEERTAILLLDLYKRLRACGLAQQDGYTLPLTQNELANTLGLHPIHVNRVMARLRARKLIARTGLYLTILDKEGLEALAASD